MSHDWPEMSRSDQPDLTTEQYQQIVELAREGIPLAVIARKFHVTRQCLYMRKGRGGEIGTALQRAVAEASADYVIGLHRKMRQMAEEGINTWTGLARLLQWSGEHYQTTGERVSVALDKARIAALRKGEDESQSRARALREFMEQAIAAAEGDEAAPLGHTGEQAEE